MSYPRATIIEKDPDFVKVLLTLAARNLKLLLAGREPDVHELGYTTIDGLIALLERLTEKVEEAKYF